jgi:dTDP-4-amino-4,6-dideoxygalactose transaminase
MYKRYHHDVVGVNSRLDSIQAAVLNTKLPHLDSYNKARQNAARNYTTALKNTEGILTPKAGKMCTQICENCDCHVFHQYTIRILNNKRDGLIKHLSDSNIPFGVYYPIPLHRQKAYLNSRYNENDFSNTNLLCEQVISLPMHSELELDQINFICEKINSFLK